MRGGIGGPPKDELPPPFLRGHPLQGHLAIDRENGLQELALKLVLEQQSHASLLQAGVNLIISRGEDKEWRKPDKGDSGWPAAKEEAWSDRAIGYVPSDSEGNAPPVRRPGSQEPDAHLPASPLER
ncbi:hypothetical protein EAI_12476 [Harpegnathos saltator]|uniref:Uncharacterized protein n=1 Tax=Harpegnathos saltator TaxID=610380 RepID=E2B4H0_HARSA|nr:hypothetical protein EAI_12476 [Harpegnathos saltator]